MTTAHVEERGHSPGRILIHSAAWERSLTIAMKARSTAPALLSFAMPPRSDASAAAPEKASATLTDRASALLPGWASVAPQGAMTLPRSHRSTEVREASSWQVAESMTTDLDSRL